MKRISRMAGVTLLEIMLVLAIAAMVIVMSIRYYQSASSGQKVNAAMNTITAIVAAGENYLNAKGNYTGITTSGLGPYGLGSPPPASPWGGTIALASAAANTFTITFTPNPPSDSCVRLSNLVQGNKKMSIDATTCVVTVNAY